MSATELDELQRDLLGNTENGDADVEAVIGDQDDEEEEPVTAQSVLAVLKKAWLNEKFSPEILPHQTEHVECMLEQIKCMERNVDLLQRNDIRADIHRFELERIRYMITSYLRCRLKKIERFAFHILEEETSRTVDERYLSPYELKFANEYVKHLDTYFECVLKEMPVIERTLEAFSKRIKPNTESYVFLRAISTVSNVVVKDVFENRDEEVELKENSQHLLPYSCVADYVKSKSVQLI